MIPVIHVRAVSDVSSRSVVPLVIPARLVLQLSSVLRAMFVITVSNNFPVLSVLSVNLVFPLKGNF